MNERHDDLQEIIDAALREMAAEEGDGFDPQACNLAEFCRRTGLTRSRARTVRAHGFRALPHGNSGRRAAPGVLAGHTGLVDDLLRKGVTNSQVIFERLLGQGYAGGLTTVKTYIAAHRDLVPAKRRQAAPQGCRGQRFRTAPGEAYQMDWGFVAVERPGGERARIACFAMVCHHCGSAHVEFFPNARQENLLIGMLHAFSALGVPATVLTDNMKSVVVRRDADGRPVWQADYAEFMGVVGFRTRLCRPRHPYTKGKVERLVRFVKGNFLAGRSFTDLDALNREAALWCAEQGGRWRRAAACVPMREHEAACSANTRPLEVTAEVERYLCPRRKISFDGFVSFEGHRYGVPYWYVRHECRVNRGGAWCTYTATTSPASSSPTPSAPAPTAGARGSGRHRRRSPRSYRPSRWGPWSSRSPRPGRNPVSRGSTSGGPNDGGRGGEPLRARERRRVEARDRRRGGGARGPRLGPRPRRRGDGRRGSHLLLPCGEEEARLHRDAAEAEQAAQARAQDLRGLRLLQDPGPNAMVLTSNIAPSGWDEFFTGDDTLLCALDRLFDKASVFVMRGPSYRGRGLDTYSVEAVPQAVKVRGIQPEGM